MSTSDRKRQILDAAQELLQSLGYTGFSYQDLSRRLGIAKPSIHHHFPTKEALGLALIQDYGERLLEMQRQLESEAQSPTAQLRALLAYGEQECLDHDHAICPGGALQADFENLPEAMQAATKRLGDEMHSWLAGILRRGRGAGELRFPGSPEDAGWSLMAGLQGARQQSRTHGVEVWRAVARQLESTLLGAS